MKHQTIRSQHAGLAERVCRFIDQHVEDELTLATLAKHAKVSPGHLQRVFKGVLGISPKEYAAARRLEKLKSGLKNNGTVAAAVYEAGYGSSSRVYENSNEQLGMTPATYKRGGTDMEIRYTIGDCLLGRILLAGTERGVCAVTFGDKDRELEEALKLEYPKARIEKDDGDLEAWIEVVRDHLSGNHPHLNLPLDVQATAFQWKVWQELRKIPYGQTKSYSDIAKTLGQPKANRAVARACATNPVSVVIPCHRVVREDGHLGGYRWGIERKQKLLEMESDTQQTMPTDYTRGG